MSNDANETVVAANGAVSVAPLGSTLPTDAGSALDAAFTALGYISEDGVVIGNEIESDGLPAWQSFQPIRYLVTGSEITAQFALMQWNADTLPFAFGGGQFTDNGDGTFDFALPLPEERKEVALVIDAVDGDRKYRIVMERVQVTDLGDINFQRGDSANLDVTVQALAGTDGRPAIIYGDNPDARPPGANPQSITPTGGSTAGGDPVTISGFGFTGATEVTFDGVAAAGFTVDSDSTISATTPAGTGTVDVVVEHPDGNGTLSGGFTYS